MKRSIAAAAGLAVGALLAVGVFAGSGRGAPPAVFTAGPTIPQDLGVGEHLLLVVGGTYATQAEAEAANAKMAVGDIQGYYVVPIAQFLGLREQLPGAKPWVLASAFRTLPGAQEFAALMASAGYPATITPTRVTSLGGLYVGLGQETAPDGSGPLLHPVPASIG